MPESITLEAPAKLNLFLHVTGRRPNGYHELETVFVMINLTDTLTIERLDKSLIERAGDVIGEPERDLCVRAARLLQSECGCSLGARIHVTKRIPSGAGLGGGSSDAASTLIALNRLWNLNLPRERLQELGLRLGADVPFFVFGRNAYATGLGEELTAVDVPEHAFALLMPQKSTATSTVYADPFLTRNTKSLTIALFSQSLIRDWPRLPGHNDLQDVVVRDSEPVRQALRFLGEHARMTGSGSACFAPARDLADARQRIADVPDGMHGYAVAILPEHPSLRLVP